MKNSVKKILNYGLWTSLIYLISEVKYFLFYRMLLGTYSQKQEDLVIDRLIGNKKKNGFYVDIGANDPIRFNNTYRFYKKGWRGINVEPNINIIKKLNKIRPRDTNINYGLSGSRGKLFFYSFYTDTLSTFSKKEAEEYVKKGFDLESIKKIDTVTMKELFIKYKINKIDILSIDTEGYDLIILKSNDWEKFRPKVLCVESAIFGDDSSNNGIEIRKYVTGNGYRLVYENGLNAIYIDSL